MSTIKPLESDAPLIVYLDFKSPYAYLAWAPARALARELGVAVDWRPFVLDIPSYLGSARLDRSGRVAEQSRTPEQWSGVKYAYFDCRRYANLRGLTVRGTVKIWDTNLASVGMLWARRQGTEVLERYVDAVYLPFWQRALEVEDPQVIRELLARSGADVAGFEDYVAAEGAAENAALQEAAFAAGIFGVPTFEVAGERYFGREHLPRVRWHLNGERGPAPDVAYEGYPAGDAAQASPAQQAGATRLEVCIDFSSPQSYLALAPTLSLARRLGLSPVWHPRLTSAGKPPVAADASGDRATRHRYLRAVSLARDLERYAPHPLRDLYPGFDAVPAAIGLLWVEQQAPARLDRYVQATFQRYWRDGAAIDEASAIASLLASLGLPADGFAAFCAGEGPALLDHRRRDLDARGVMGTPTYLLGDEPFLGRQHLPLIEARLAASG